MVSRYFEAIAIIQTDIRGTKFKGNVIGKISVIISAVIKTDSTFVVAHRIFAIT